MGNPLRDRRTAAEWASVGQAIEITEKVGAFEGLAAIVAEDLAALEPDHRPGDPQRLQRLELPVGRIRRRGELR